MGYWLPLNNEIVEPYTVLTFEGTLGSEYSKYIVPVSVYQLASR